MKVLLSTFVITITLIQLCEIGKTSVGCIYNYSPQKASTGCPKCAIINDRCSRVHTRIQ